jgi:cell wall-associated NlpC family hydrolase
MRARSQLVLVALMAAASAACATSGAVPRPFPAPAGRGAEPSSRPARPGGYGVTGTALALRGTPYRDGGADPAGFDCSGFVQYVFAQHAVALPHAVSEQYRIGRPVPPADLAPGDLIFFTTVAPGASHVGIAIGGDKFVHAPSSRGEVRVERLSASYWSRRFVGARRVL